MCRTIISGAGRLSGSSVHSEKLRIRIPACGENSGAISRTGRNFQTNFSQPQTVWMQEQLPRRAVYSRTASYGRQCESGSTPVTTGIITKLFGIKMSESIYTGIDAVGVPSLVGLGKRIGKAVTIIVGHNDKKHAEQNLFSSAVFRQWLSDQLLSGC